MYADLFAHDDGDFVLKLHRGVFGFREMGRRDWGRGEEMVTLKLGRSLVLEIDVKKAEAPAATPAAVPVAA